MVRLREFVNNIPLIQPFFLKLLKKDFFKIRNEVKSNDFHLRKGIDWLIYARNATKDDGISLGYSLLYGWYPSYPETSGYIIPTLLNYYHKSNYNIYFNISKKIAKWLTSIQLKNGAFQGGMIDQEKIPSIFNTGQILFGLIRAFIEFNEDIFIESAIKAGDFLVKNQDQNGKWAKYCYNNDPHTYNVRTAWALLELFKETDVKKYQESAIKNYNWALTQIKDTFWFQNNGSPLYKNPILHFISYTIRGFLEGGMILGDEEYLNVAINSALKLLDYFENHGWLPGTYNSNWESENRYSCLTGNAQLSIIWLKIFQINKEKSFLKNGIKLNNNLKSVQTLDEKFKFIDGAIKGSYPIWGKYMRWTFPNWATKFFCDALILESKINHI